MIYLLSSKLVWLHYHVLALPALALALGGQPFAAESRVARGLMAGAVLCVLLLSSGKLILDSFVAPSPMGYGLGAVAASALLATVIFVQLGREVGAWRAAALSPQAMRFW
jgi:hypothetical protein